MRLLHRTRPLLGLAGLALCLAGCGSPPVDQPPPAVYVNHFSRVLDTATYQAIVDSGFLREQLCNLRVDEVADEHGGWSGAYLFGEQVYLELFPEDASRNRLAGSSALVLGVEEPGGASRLFDLIVARIEAHVLHRLRMRKLDGKDVPWFYETSVDWQDPQALLATWIMEYHPDFLAARDRDGPGTGRGITRKAYLARDYDPDRLLNGITEAVFALDATETEHVVQLMSVLGWKIEPDKLETRCRGPETLLRLVPKTEESRGLVSLTLALNRKIEPRIEKFGDHSTLTFSDDGTAEWDF